MTARYLLCAVLLLLLGLHYRQEQQATLTWTLLQRLDPARNASGAPAPTAPVLLGQDSYLWCRYASDLIASGQPRLHFTHTDNAPAGRPVHWASAYLWWMIALGALRSLFTGEPLALATVLASPWANLPLFAAFLALAWFSARRLLGPQAAAPAVLLLAASPLLASDFGYALPDHHSMHNLAALGLLIGLPLAARSTSARARNGFILLSALSGAFGLWIGATQQIVIIGLATLGAALPLLIRHLRPSVATQNSQLPWRLWGLAGATASLLLWLLEYAPDHLLDLRLEINNPLYALAFLASGEFLHLLDRPAPAKFPSVLRLLPVILLGLLPIALILFGPAEVHALRDPVMRIAHTRIEEFQPWLPSLAPANLLPALLALLATLPLFLLALYRVIRPSSVSSLNVGRWTLDVPHSAVTAPLLAALGLLAAMLLQTRWGGLAATAIFVAALSAAPNLRQLRLAAILAAIANFALLLPLVLAPAEENETEATTLATQLTALRDTADLLRADLQQSGAPAPVVLLGRHLPYAGAWDYFAAIPGIGSLYWENVAGLHAEADILGSGDDALALRTLRARGVTHIIVHISDIPSVKFAHLLAHGADTGPFLPRTLALRLSAPVPSPPAWLVPLDPEKFPPALRLLQVRIYRFVPPTP